MAPNGSALAARASISLRSAPPSRSARAGGLGAAPHPRPALLAEERHEADIGDVLGLEVVLIDARDADELLGARVGADRDHHAAADLELLLQRSRNLGAASRHDDSVVGRVLGPAQRAVGVQHVHVVVAEIGKFLRRLGRELADALDREDLAGDAGEDRGGIAGAGADLEHLLAARKPKCLGHERNDVWLRDRLRLADRQRRVLVGVLAQVRGQECLARNRVHGLDHERRAHTAGGDVMLDHVAALLRIIGHGRLPFTAGRARDHCSLCATLR
jgi:hypothetical protein